MKPPQFRSTKYIELIWSIRKHCPSMNFLLFKKIELNNLLLSSLHTGKRASWKYRIVACVLHRILDIWCRDDCLTDFTVTMSVVTQHPGALWHIILNSKLPSYHCQFQFIKRENQFQCNRCNLKTSCLLIGKSELDIPKKGSACTLYIIKFFHIYPASVCIFKICNPECKRALWLQWISVDSCTAGFISWLLQSRIKAVSSVQPLTLLVSKLLVQAGPSYRVNCLENQQKDRLFVMKNSTK